MDGYVENGDVSGGHDSMNIHTLYQLNILIWLMYSIKSDDIDTNGDLNNGDVSCGNNFINSYTISQCN